MSLPRYCRFLPRRSVNTLKPLGTLLILFFNELGPSNAAFDGPMSSSTVWGWWGLVLAKLLGD